MGLPALSGPAPLVHLHAPRFCGRYFGLHSAPARWAFGSVTEMVTERSADPFTGATRVWGGIRLLVRRSGTITLILPVLGVGSCTVTPCAGGVAIARVVAPPAVPKPCAPNS